MPRVLVVEDDTSLNAALTRSLKDNGMEVVSAFNGEDGLTKALDEENPVDIILLDLAMPIKDGFQFLDDYLGKKAIPAPILVLTNLSDFGSQMKTYKKGVVSYLIKANTPLEEIIKKVNSLIL